MEKGMKHLPIEKNIEKRIGTERSLKYVVRLIFDRAVKQKLPHKEILEQIKTLVYMDEGYRKLGNVGRGVITGYIDAHMVIHHANVEWCCWYDGKFMGLTKNFEYTDDYQQDLMETANVYKGWKETGEIKRY